MRTVGFALVLAVSAALGGCGSVDLGNLHFGDTAPAAAQTGVLSLETEDALYLGAIEGLEKQERFGAALAFLDQFAVKEKDLPPRYWLLRGNALSGSARYAEASAAFDKLDATSLASSGWDGKGRAAAASRQWTAASDAFQKAVLSDPSNADFLNNLAYAQLHLGLVVDAEGNLRQAQELAPQSGLIRNNLAIALTMRGDRAGADDILRAVKNGPERDRITALARKFAQTSVSSTEEKL